MTSRRRFKSLNDLNRLRTYTAYLHRPLSAAELADGVRTLRRGFLVLAGVVSVAVASTAYFLFHEDARTPEAIEAQLAHPRVEVRERAMRVAVRESLHFTMSCLPLLNALADSSSRIRSAAMPALVTVLNEGHCTGQLLRVLDSAQSGAARQRLLQIIASTGTRYALVLQHSLLRALQRDSASEGAAAIALGIAGNGSTEVLNALRAAAHEGQGIARVEALSALLKLEPSCKHVPLVHLALHSGDSFTRRVALESLEPLLIGTNRNCPEALSLVQQFLGDTSQGVSEVARSLLAVSAR